MLAIVIPYYKHTFFEATLESLASQTDKRFKVYIGDDASPENPISLLEKYKKKFDFVYHRFESNLGSTSLTKQWERCISMTCDEDWIMLLGDDDYMSNNCVKEFYIHLGNVRRANINLIRFATQLIKELDFVLVLGNVYTHPIVENVNDFFWRKLTGKTRSSMSEYVFKREMYNKYLFNDFPLGWHSDDMAVFEFSNFNYIYSLNSALVYIRVSEISITGNTRNAKIKYDATIYFYKKLLFKYSNKLSINIKCKIIQKIEEPFYIKWKFRSYLSLVFLHLQYLGIYSMLKFNRRILINRNKSF